MLKSLENGIYKVTAFVKRQFYLKKITSISLSCLISLTRTSSIIGVGDLVLFLILKENLLSFYHWAWCQLLACHIWSLLFEVCSSNAHFVERLFFFFYYERMLNFVKCFYCIFWNNHMSFVFYSIKVVYHIHWFAYIELSLHLKDKSHSIMIYDPFTILLNSVCWYFAADFCLYVH